MDMQRWTYGYQSEMLLSFMVLLSRSFWPEADVCNGRALHIVSGQVSIRHFPIMISNQ
jgi:hypothetical protein